MRVLVVNAGSSSLKLSVIGEGDETQAVQDLGAPSEARTLDDMRTFVAAAQDVDAVGHRIVHGGPDLRRTVIIDDRVHLQLDAAAEIAPLHVPPALHVLDVLRDSLHVPHVACFDTSFHAELPPAASTYAVPLEWREVYGIRRYGFHGLSCAWSLRRAAQLLRRDAGDLRLLVAHLGAGASVTAIRHGRSADTTMGFTPLEGLVMATRSGTVDPGALLWLQAARGMSVGELSHDLEHASGLLGLGGSSDMRDVLAGAAEGEERAVLSRGVFVHSASRLIAAMAASLEGVDALIFTGGVGEHAAEIRTAICAGLEVLHMPKTLRTPPPGEDEIISEADAVPAVLVVHAREDLQIAHEVRRALA